MAQWHRLHKRGLSALTVVGSVLAILWLTAPNLNSPQTRVWGPSARLTASLGPALSLNSYQGGPGSTIGASGSGFPSSTAISFDVAGVAVSQAACSTTSSGTFSNCHFTVPPEDPGPTLASASVPTAPLSAGATIQLPSGSGPAGLAFDPYLGEIFAADSSSNSVSIVNDSTFAISSLAVGSDPVGVAFASDYNEMFVSNNNAGGAGSVSAIYAANSTVRSTVTVGYGPQGLAYNSNTSQLFVADTGSNNVDVISLLNSSIIAASIPVSGGPYGIATDWDSQIFVTDSLNSKVSVLNASTRSVSASVSVGSNPEGIVYDLAKDEFFIANSGSGTVSVISGHTRSVVSTISVGGAPSGLAYDPSTGEIVVVDSTCGQGGGATAPPASCPVSVISDKTLAVVQTLTITVGLTGATFDGTTGNVCVAAQSNSKLTAYTAISFVARAFLISPQLTFGGYPNTAFHNNSSGPAPFAAKNGWIEDAHYANCWWIFCAFQSSMQGEWEVPSAPTTQSSQTVFLFPGLEPSSTSWIIQPVLEWGSSCAGGGSYYSIDSFAVSGKPCSTAVWGYLQSVSSGDILLGTMKLTMTCFWFFGCIHNWRITTADLNSGAFSSLTTSSPPAGMTDAYVTLESYSVTSCSEYPANGSTPFRSMSVSSGTPGWGNQYPNTDCSADNVAASGSTNVTLSY